MLALHVAQQCFSSMSYKVSKRSVGTKRISMAGLNVLLGIHAQGVAMVALMVRLDVLGQAAAILVATRTVMVGTNMLVPVVLTQIGVICVAGGIYMMNVKVSSTQLGIRALAAVQDMEVLLQRFPFVIISTAIRADVVFVDGLRPITLQL